MSIEQWHRAQPDTPLFEQEPAALALLGAIRVSAVHPGKFDEVKTVKDPFEVVRAWHDAVNRGDADGLVALSRDNIEIGGPRGAASGSAILRDWLDRAGIQLEPKRWFAGPDILVVEQAATWRTPEGGLTDPDIIASSFQLEKGLVSRMVRFSSVEDALAMSGLTMQDEISNTEG